MGSYGGNKVIDKSKNSGDFFSEKRGFLRAINGYSSANLTESSPVRCENGPNAFLSTVDYKYKDKTACATDRGRSFNINHQSPNESFEKSEPIYRNKITNIKSYDNYNHLECIEEYEPKPYKKESWRNSNMVNSLENMSPKRANDYLSLSKIYHNIKPLSNNPNFNEKIKKTTFYIGNEDYKMQNR
jgi:hypothetical protein